MDVTGAFGTRLRAVIDLDSAAPVIAWGPATGLTAGELLQIAYEIDEPEVIGAELTLVGGTVLTMTVASDRLTVLLPYDAPAGLATISAYVRDAAGNEAIRSTTVLIAGTIVVIPPAPQSTAPASTPGTIRRVIPGGISSSRARSRTAVSRRAPRRPATAVGRSSYRVVGRRLRGDALHLTRTAARARSAARVSTHRAYHEAAHVRETTTVRRRDGPEIEAWLILELL